MLHLQQSQEDQVSGIGAIAVPGLGTVLGAVTGARGQGPLALGVGEE